MGIERIKEVCESLWMKFSPMYLPKGSQRGVAAPSTTGEINHDMLKVLSLKNRIREDLTDMQVRPEKGTAWVFHDNSCYQLIAHLEPPRSSYPKKPGEIKALRNESARKSMRVFFHPEDTYDKTHTLPIRYHGSDADPRLIVGWSSDENQNLLKIWEDKQGKRETEIYWVCTIEKTISGATWSYECYDALTLNKLDYLTTELHTTFHWS